MRTLDCKRISTPASDYLRARQKNGDAMGRVLLSVLGNGPYEHRDYSFSGRLVGRSLFLKALADHLVTDRSGTQRIVLIGTSGSGWHLLLRLAIGDDHPDVTELRQKSAADAADPGIYSAHAEALAKTFGAPVEPVMSCYLANPADIRELVQILDGKVGDGDRLSFVITNGMRHMPLMVLVAAATIRVTGAPSSMPSGMAGLRHAARHSPRSITWKVCWGFSTGWARWRRSPKAEMSVSLPVARGATSASRRAPP